MRLRGYLAGKDVLSDAGIVLVCGVLWCLLWRLFELKDSVRLLELGIHIIMSM